MVMMAEDRRGRPYHRSVLPKIARVTVAVVTAR